MALQRKVATSSAARTVDEPPKQEEDEATESVIIDLGKGSRKEVRKLRKGKPGKLMKRVEKAIEHLRESSEFAADTAVVVMIVRERKRRRRLLSLR